MSFGYSISDCIAGANLSYHLVKALRDTQGVEREYQEAIDELGSIQHTSLQVSMMRESNVLSRSTIDAASYIITSSMQLIGDFLERTKDYEQSFRSRLGSSVFKNSWHRVGWTLFKKDEIKLLRDTLHAKLTSIYVLLDAAKL